MIFKVSEKCKGSFVLSTVKKPLWAGTTVSISGKDIYAEDVKNAVKRGLLIPQDDKYNKDHETISSEAVITNRTDKVLVLGEFVLRPWASLPVDKKMLSSAAIVAAEENKYIQIISDENLFYDEPEEVIEEIPKKKEKKKTKKKVSKKKKAEKKEEPVGEDREVTPVVWDFKQQETKEAEVVPKTPDVIRVDEEETPPEVDFVDEKPIKKKASQKKKSVKKRTIKKSKKKGISKKSKKVKTLKTLKPIGDVKLEKTQADAAIELDSRGNPLSKASDTLQHMIDEIDSGEEMSFTDEEQAQERLDKRNRE